MKNIKALIALLVFAAAVYATFKVAPVYLANYQFQDAMEEEARINSYTGKSESDMRDTMWKKAQSLELPLTSPEQIKVERNGTSVTISTEYSVHVDLPGYPLDLKFSPNSRNKAAY